MRTMSFFERVTRAVELGVVASGAAVGGGVLAYFLDPDRGHARRVRSRDQIGAATRTILRRGRRVGLRTVRPRLDHLEGETRGRILRMVRRASEPDDVTLAQKVRSEVLGPLGHRSGQIAVDAAAGYVTLRGECDFEDHGRALAEAVEKVEGVRGVHNLLHHHGEVPPNKAAALGVHPRPE